MNRSALPSAITSYDLLKFLALVFMVIDHIGAFIYPDADWLRVIGRFSAPIWLFLIGYARSREMSVTMIAGTLILMVSNFSLGAPILPVAILGTMLLCRLTIDPIMNVAAKAPATLYPVAVMLFLAAIPSLVFIEYGTAAMLFVMIGYMVRNQNDLPFTQGQVLQFTCIASAMYVLIQMLLFSNFDFAQGAVTGLGVVFIAMALTLFRPAVYENMGRNLTPIGAAIIKIGGRWSLEFYVVQMVLFRAIQAFLHPDSFKFFTLHILP